MDSWRCAGNAQFWLPMALIPPQSFSAFSSLAAGLEYAAGMRMLQFPWRWLVVLDAPMAISFAAAVWFDRKTPRIFVIAACAAVFVGISFAAPRWWFAPCGSLIDSLQGSVRKGIGVIGKPEYAPPGTRFPLINFRLDAQGNLVLDPQGNPIAQALPDACLLDSVPAASIQGGAPPAWRGELANCQSTGWRQMRLSNSSLEEAATDFP